MCVMFGVVFVKCFGFNFKYSSANALGTNCICSIWVPDFDVEICIKYKQCSLLYF